METLTSQSGTVHSIGGSPVRVPGRHATTCGMHFGRSFSVIDGEPTCRYCVASIAHSETIGDLASQGTREVSALAASIGVSEEVIRDAVAGTWNLNWREKDRLTVSVMKPAASPTKAAA